LLGRSDYAIIGEIVSPGARVLDLGCGEGELLQWLASNKGVDARGVEIAGEKGAPRHRPRRLGVSRRYRRGTGRLSGRRLRLRDPQPDLAGNRQPAAVLREMLRVGRRGIVAFPNFGHWRVRLSMLASGRAPRTKLFPYEWYDSPNIHFLTVEDFEALAALESLTVERRYFLAGHRKVK
jgi:SAM-dependent methyltransferase